LKLRQRQYKKKGQDSRSGALWRKFTHLKKRTILFTKSKAGDDVSCTRKRIKNITKLFGGAKSQKEHDAHCVRAKNGYIDSFGRSVLFYLYINIYTYLYAYIFRCTMIALSNYSFDTECFSR